MPGQVQASPSASSAVPGTILSESRYTGKATDGLSTRSEFRQRNGCRMELRQFVQYASEKLRQFVQYASDQRRRQSPTRFDRFSRQFSPHKKLSIPLQRRPSAAWSPQTHQRGQSAPSSSQTHQRGPSAPSSSATEVFDCTNNQVDIINIFI